MKYALFILGLLILPSLALAQTGGPGFIPLTNIPFLTETGNAFNLDSFLNGLYRLCIGAAAVLAVLQIMRAGIMYMGGDSVTEKKEAKNLIALSIGGLILVLSPVVVFSVINPEILSLKIDVSGLERKFKAESEKVLWTDNVTARETMKTRCEKEGGVPAFACQSKDGGEKRTVPITEGCKPDETAANECRASQAAPDSVNSCKDQYAKITAIDKGRTCNAAGNYNTIPRGCCAGIAEGGVCCGTLKNDEDTQKRYGWKAWYLVPKASSTPVSTLLVSATFGTKEACIANATATSTKPAGSVYDTSEGKRTPCTCDTPISEQKAGVCNPW